VRRPTAESDPRHLSLDVHSGPTESSSYVDSLQKVASVNRNDFNGFVLFGIETVTVCKQLHDAFEVRKPTARL
jgi:hypothetical protein